MEKEPLETVQISTGTRVYYFDIHKDRKGQLYLAISEIPTERHPGNKKRGKIFVHGNNLALFIDALQHVADTFQKGERHD